MKKTLAEKLNLTPDEYQELCHMARQAWNYIAHDVIECGGRGLTRSEVIEVVLDADHMLMNNPGVTPNVKALLKRYDKKTSNLLRLALKTDVFRFAGRYE